ncbi:heavy-metal-associated domain-containing protein [archaeon]
MELRVRTKGMHCSSCEMLVTDALEELPGVNDVEADWESGFVTVDVDESKVTPEQIKSAIEQEGYTLE